MGIRSKLKSKTKSAAKRVVNRVRRGMKAKSTEEIHPTTYSAPVEEVADAPDGFAAEESHEPAEFADEMVQVEASEEIEEEDLEALTAETDAMAAELIADEPKADLELGQEMDEETSDSTDKDEGEEIRPPKLEGPEAETMQAAIIESIQTIFDPEIPVNIYELGLIYDVDIHEGNKAFISMTLTSPNCPAAQSLPVEVKTKAEGVDGVDEATVDIVWDPVWGPHLMSEEARLELNL